MASRSETSEWTRNKENVLPTPEDSATPDDDGHVDGAITESDETAPPPDDDAPTSDTNDPNKIISFPNISKQHLVEIKK